MDAGIAAVLGAAVGSVSTGVAAFVARAQTRVQVKAEHLRLIREPRKGVYTAYSEACEQELDRLREVLHTVTLAGGSDSPESWNTHMDDVQDLITAFAEHVRVRERLQSQVYIEGPRSVIDAAVKLRAEIICLQRTILWRAGQVSAGGTWSARMLRDLDDLSVLATEAHLRFLDAASAAVNADGLRRLPK